MTKKMKCEVRASKAIVTASKQEGIRSCRDYRPVRRARARVAMVVKAGAACERGPAAIGDVPTKPETTSLKRVISMSSRRHTESQLELEVLGYTDSGSASPEERGTLHRSQRRVKQAQTLPL